MLVHEGFRGLWTACGKASNLKVSSNTWRSSSNSPNLPWWFHRHSLGAALATLAARRFGHAHGLYTYGSPKVGDAAFVAQVDTRWRHTTES